MDLDQQPGGVSVSSGPAVTSVTVDTMYVYTEPQHQIQGPTPPHQSQLGMSSVRVAIASLIVTSIFEKKY